MYFQDIQTFIFLHFINQQQSSRFRIINQKSVFKKMDMHNCQTSQYVRVVKEADSKSAGFSRAGSNPAADVFFIYCNQVTSFLLAYSIVTARIDLSQIAQYFKINTFSESKKQQRNMLNQIIGVIIISLIVIYFRYVFLPRRRINRYKKQLQALGYKVRLYPFNPFSSSQFDQFFAQGQKYGNCFKTLKSPECYQADILLHNVLDKIIIEFVNLDLVKQQYAPERVYNQKKVTFVFQSLIATLGKGIVFSQGQVWKAKRKTISSVFNFDLLKANISKMIQACHQQFDIFERQCKAQQKPLKAYLLHLNAKILANILVKSFFGDSLSQEKFEGRSIAEFFSQLFNDMSIQSLNPLGLVLGHWIFKLELTALDRKIKKNSVFFRKIASQFVRKRYDQIICQGVSQNPSDMIQCLYKQGMISDSKDKKDHQYSFQDLVDQFSIFYAAGTDTTGHSLMALIYFISLNPQIENKVRNEVDQYIKSDRDITFQNLKKMVYIDWLQNQVIRFAGPGGFIFWREAITDQNIGNVPVPKGIYVGAMSIPAHFNPKYYKNPQEFRPERWQKQCDNLPPFAFCGFGAGPRSCIGKTLSYLESKIILIIYLRRYKQFKLPVQQLRWIFGSTYEPQRFDTQFVRH